MIFNLNDKSKYYMLTQVIKENINVPFPSTRKVIQYGNYIFSTIQVFTNWKN